jgi:hypothetical protein
LGHRPRSQRSRRHGRAENCQISRPSTPEGKRLIGPITALNGLLLIGWSVAIIFEVMRMAEVQVGRLEDKRDES